MRVVLARAPPVASCSRMYARYFGDPADQVVGQHDRAGMQPTALQDAQQDRQIGRFVVVDEQEVDRPVGEAVVGGQRVQSRAAVADGAGQAVHAIGDAGVRQIRRALAALAAESSTDTTVAWGAAGAIRRALYPQ